MSDRSRIEWCHATWNPIAGCTRVSPGCHNCYALKLHNRRYKANVKAAVDRFGTRIPHREDSYEGLNIAQVNRTLHGWAATAFPQTDVYDVPFTQVRTRPEVLGKPLRWRAPRRIFVNSMSDLFHEDVPDEFIDRVFAVMALAPQHTFQVLTKRPKRMRAYCADRETPFRVARAQDAIIVAREIAELNDALERIRDERAGAAATTHNTHTAAAAADDAAPA